MNPAAQLGMRDSAGFSRPSLRGRTRHAAAQYQAWQDWAGKDGMHPPRGKAPTQSSIKRDAVRGSDRWDASQMHG